MLTGRFKEVTLYDYVCMKCAILGVKDEDKLCTLSRVHVYFYH
jgi:predicted nucleotidyltransferase